MECPSCASTIPDSSTSCVYCGATIPAAARQPAAGAAGPGTEGSGSSRKWLIGCSVTAVGFIIAVVSILAPGCGFSDWVGFGDDPEPTSALFPPQAAPAAPVTADRSPPAAPVTADRPPPAAPVTADRPPPAAPVTADRPPPAAPVTVTDNTVVFSDLNWTSARVQNRIAQYIIEYGYGHPTDVLAGSTVHMFESLRRGEVDVAMEIWLPLQAAEWGQALANDEVQYVGSSMGSDWQSTFVIPAYLQEEYPGLDHVDDLKDPRYRELFATATSNGKARLVACVVGWACQEGNDAQIAGYGLIDHVQVVRPDSQEELFSEVYDAYAKGKPWLGYLWGTSDPALLLDLARLEETPYSDECWFTTKACGFKEVTILTAVHSDLPGRAPELVHLLQQWDFDIPEYQGLLRWMDDNNATEEEAALHWLRTKGDTWKYWVTEQAYASAQAALTAGVDARGWPSR